MKMNIDLDKLTDEELGKLFPIVISEPDESWPRHFETEKEKIEHCLGTENIRALNHIGSTAVQGLPAKPTIDIILEVDQNAETETIITQLKKLDYHYINRPDNPPPHMMFVKGYTSKGMKECSWHIHVRYEGDWDEIYFRDYLRSHSEIAREYATLKVRLAKVHKNDREAYTNGKTEFVTRITKLARLELTDPYNKTICK